MLHEMTRTTSAERAKLVRVESHDVALDLTRDDEHFGATPVIRFSGLRPGAAGHADLRAGKVPRLLAPYAALFPYTAASPELLSQIDEFLADPALEPAWPASRRNAATWSRKPGGSGRCRADGAGRG